ncbi:hypothetical protein D3C71_2151840 [compost metagenome]
MIDCARASGGDLRSSTSWIGVATTRSSLPLTAVWSFMLKTSFEALSKTASDQNGTAPLARNRAGPSAIEKLQTAVRR